MKCPSRVFLTALFLGSASLSAELSLAGRVLDAEGRPFAGAEILVEPIPAEYARTALRLAGEVGPPPVARTQCDADGAWQLSVPEPANVKVVATAPGRRPMAFLFMPLVESEVLPPVELAPTAELQIQIVDAEGRPRPAALMLRGRAGTDRWRPYRRRAVAGEDGVATVPRATGEAVRIYVLAPGHPLTWRDLEADDGRRGALRLRLPAGVAGTVAVTHPGGRPAADVLAYQMGGDLPLGRTGEDGRLDLVLDTETPPRLAFIGADGSFASVVPSWPPAAETGVLEVVLRAPSTFTGRVVELASGDGIAGALVWGNGGFPIAVTDRSGGFDLPWRLPRRLDVWATAPGFGMAREGRGSAPGAGAPDTEATELVLTLAHAAVVQGRVTDADGRGLADVAVEVQPVDGYRPRRYRGGWSFFSGRDGAFEMTRLDADTAYAATFQRPGFAPAQQRLEPVAHGEPRPELTVVLEAGRVGVGRVVDEDGAPVAGAEARLTEAAESSRWRRQRPGPAVTSDAEGRLRFEDLGSGHYDLAVRAAGFAPLTVPGIELAAGAAGPIELGTVVLAPGARVDGQVLDADGVPLADAAVRVRDPRFGVRREVDATSGADGRFVVADRKDGEELELLIHRKGFGSARVRTVARIEGTPLTVTLERAGRLSGRVVDVDGRPVAGARLRALPASRDGGWNVEADARSDERGRFELTGSPPGPIDLQTVAEGFRESVRRLEVPPGGELGDLELVLEPGAVIVGTVLDADGRGVPDIELSLRRDDPQGGFGWSGHGRTDGAGHFRIDSAPLGERVLVARAAHAFVERPIEVVPGEQRVDLELPAGFEVAGRVFGPDGLPVSGAALDLGRNDGHRVQSYGTSRPTLSAVDGSFRFTHVTPGRYTLGARKQGFAPASPGEPIEVDDHVMGLEIELGRSVTLTGRVLGLELEELARLHLGVGDRVARVSHDGTYRVTDLGAGEQHVWARVEGTSASLSTRWEIPPGVSELERDLEFPTGHTVEGLVLRRGEPAGDVRVSIYRIDGRAGSVTVSGQAVTDGSGRFILRRLAEGRYQVSASAPSGSHTFEQIEIPSAGEVRLELPGARLAGWVLDAVGGKPLARARIQLRRLVETASLRQLMGSGAQTQTDSVGFFQHDVEPGTWRIEATSPGYGPATVTVELGPDEDRGDLELRLAATEGWSFEVVMADGSRPERVEAVVLDPAGRPLVKGTYRVDVAGRVRMPTVPPGTWDLVVTAPGSAASRQTFTVPSDPGRIGLEPGGQVHLVIAELSEESPDPDLRVRLRIEGPGGRAYPFAVMPGFEIWAQALGPDVWPVFRGQVMIPALPAGTWTLHVHHEDGRSWTGQAVVVPGEVVRVELRGAQGSR